MREKEAEKWSRMILAVRKKEEEKKILTVDLEVV